MKVVFLLLSLLAPSLVAQPLPPKTDRVVLWSHTNKTEITGYRLIFGTNVIQILGSSNTSATLTLLPGANTIVLQAAGTNGVYSDPTTNRIFMVTSSFQESTNGGTSWQTLSNSSYAIGNYRPSVLYRTKLNGPL